MRYAIVIEKASSNYSAYCPDLLGCIATGDTIEEVKNEMTEAIELCGVERFDRKYYYKI